MSIAKGGKPKDPIWDMYIITQEDGKTVTKCMDCNAKVSAKSDRLKAHRSKCPKAKSDRKDDVHVVSETPSAATSRADPSSASSSHASPSNTMDDQPAAKKAKLRTIDMDQFVVKTTASMKSQLDEQIARAFFACNIPFNVIDQPEFVKMIQMLRPGYSPPNRKAIGGVLLDRVHEKTEKLKEQMTEQIQGKEVTLMQDGWSDIHNTPVVANTLHCDGKSYFLSAVETGTNKKTAEYCTKVAKDAVKEALDDMGCTVSAVVTDNENKMGSMRSSLKKDDPSLTVYGCSSHWLNLLGQDITPPQIISQVVEVNKYFRNHHVPTSLLGEIEG